MNQIEDEKYDRAKAHIAQLKKFYGSLLKYVLVISFLAGINYYQNEWSHAWFLWAAFGWGIGLLFRGFRTFGINPFLGKNWEDRKIQQYMSEDVQKQRWQ